MVVAKRMSGLLFTSLYFHVCVRLAFSIPAPAPMSQDTTAAIPSSPFNASLLEPEPPPGFRLQPLYWDRDVHEYDAREIWLALVAAPSQMARFPKDESVVAVQQFGMVLSRHVIFAIPHPLTTYGILVWFFWELGRQIALQNPWPRKVPKFWGEIDLAAGPGGRFVIHEPRRAVQELGSASNDSIVDFVAASRRRDTIIKAPVVRADRGRIICHDDRDLVIQYQFFAQRLSPAQVLTAFLTAQTHFSDHDGNDRGVRMSALSTDRHTGLRIAGMGSGPGRDVLTWDLARMGLRTIWRELIMGYRIDETAFVDEARWQSVSFIFNYRDVKVGQGSLGL